MTINIKVYGPGCARCEQLGEKLRIALEEEGTEASVEKVTDPAQIAAAGILSLPGLEMNGCMKCSGRVPEPAEIRYWLRETARSSAQADASGASVCACSREKGDGAQASGSCSCGSGGNKATSSCGCGGNNGGSAAESCGCGGRSTESSCCGGKRLLTIVVLILITIACVRLVAKQVYGDAATAPKSNSTPPAAAEAQQASKVMEVVYFLYGPRCVTCVNMEKWTRETVEAMKPEAADLVFSVCEAKAEDVQKYGLQAKGVVLREWSDDRELRFFNAMELWQSVRGGEEAYKNALRRLIESFRAEKQATPSEAAPSAV